MKELENKIIEYGEILPGDILKVGSFLNQRIDVKLLTSMAKEIKNHFTGRVDKILTIEASGLPLAAAVAIEYQRDMIFAKKDKTSNLAGNIIKSQVTSYTHHNTVEIFTIKDYFSKGDNVLIVDDFLAYGNALNAMLNEGYSVFNLADQSMYNIGWNLCAGLANGIIAGSDMPVNAADQMASAVVDTVNGALEVHSPSRVFYEIGDYLMQGLSQGITQNENGPVSSVTTLGDQLIQAIKSSMAQVAAMTNQSFDFQPQITPVVDMSNIRSGAAEYSSLFSGGRFSSMGMYSGISRSIQAGQRAQQAYNDMLKSAPSANASPTDSIVVNVYAAEGQSEESIADSVINRISAKSSRRSVAFG